MRIKEIIVVEGRDDERAVRDAVDAGVIVTSGFGITEETFRKIEFARQQKGVIIFTDPDHAGDQIRKRINDRVKGCKNAYLSRTDAVRGNDIGIENANSQSIREALEKARCGLESEAEVFCGDDLYEHGLAGASDSAARREQLGRILGIGYANAKQLLRRLNHYGISKDQFENAVQALPEMQPRRT